MPGLPRRPDEPVPPERLALYQHSVEVARLTVADQVSELDAIRNRCTTFLAFVGSATAFLVGTALKGSNGTPAPGFVFVGVIGCLGFVVALFLFYSVMIGAKHWYWPLAQMEWDSRLSGKTYTDWLHGDLAQKAPETGVQYYRNLASMYDTQFRTNRAYLAVTRRRYIAFLMTSTLVLMDWAIAAWLFGVN